MSEAGLLTIVQWLSPAFPVGSFAYSHGLEWAISAGEISDAPALEGWIATILTEGAGRSDAILLCHALNRAADLAELSALAEALAASRERLAETCEQGRALLTTTNALLGQDLPPMPYPVALGAAARGLGLPPRQVAGLYLQAFASALVQVGVRFVPLGQTQGQRVLSALHPVIATLAAEAATSPLAALGSGGLRADLAAMRHETLDVRIYRT
jgi:urease accessory protein